MKIAKHSQRFVGMYSQFHPQLIVLQILSMQFLFYTGLGIFFFFLNSFFGVQLHSGQFFHFTTFDTDYSYGGVAIIGNFLNFFIIICGLVHVVVKAQNVLDFVATIYSLHFIICWFYSGLQYLNWNWIFINGFFMTATILIGEYVCIKFEQRELNIEQIFTQSRTNQNQYKKAIEIVSL